MNEDEKQQEANNRRSDNLFYEDEKVGLNDILVDPQLLSDDEEQEDPLGACPPDFRLAKIHQDASKVKLMSQRKISKKDLENDEMYCSCCKMPTSKAAPNMEMCSSYNEFKELGIGFQYYYQLKCCSILGYFIIFCFSLIPLFINVSKNKGNEWNGGLETSYIVYTSIGNHGTSPDEYRFKNLLMHVFIFLFIVLGTLLASCLMRCCVSQNIQDVKKNPSDFTCMVTNIPLNKTQEDVVRYFEYYSQDLDIVYVNYCYDVKEIVEETRRLTSLQQQRDYLISYKRKCLRNAQMNEYEAEASGLDTHPPSTKRCCCIVNKYESMDTIKERIKVSEEIIETVKAKYDVSEKQNLFCGTCFIVVNKQIQAHNIAK